MMLERTKKTTRGVSLPSILMEKWDNTDSGVFLPSMVIGKVG
jgi:hypothetical protein